MADLLTKDDRDGMRRAFTRWGVEAAHVDIEALLDHADAADLALAAKDAELLKHVAEIEILRAALAAIGDAACSPGCHCCGTDGDVAAAALAAAALARTP